MSSATKGALAVALCFSAACSSSKSSPIDAGGSPDALQANCTPAAGTDLTLERVAEDLSHPVFVTSPPRDLSLFVVEQKGIIKVLGEDGTVTTFLDIEELVLDLGTEQGLLGLAFHPAYPTDPRFFVNYTAATTDEVYPFKTVIAEYRASASDPSQADPASGAVLLEIDQHGNRHNGGMLAFGPDGYLYVGMGDGGGGGDSNDPAKPEGHGQDPSTLLAALLRLDVTAQGGYEIPPDNPFADGEGGAPEVWAYGLRNPWRFSFDRATGDLYLGDVGLNDREEINYLPSGSGAGENFGWRRMEGTRCHKPASDCDTGDLHYPLTEYSHTSEGESVTGGYVYRGSCIPDIQGWYFYADYLNDRIFKFEVVNAEATAIEDLTEMLDPDRSLSSLASFGEDAAGELYVVSRNRGAVYRIVAAP